MARPRQYQGQVVGERRDTGIDEHLKCSENSLFDEEYFLDGPAITSFFRERRPIKTAYSIFQSYNFGLGCNTTFSVRFPLDHNSPRPSYSIYFVIHVLFLPQLSMCFTQI